MSNFSYYRQDGHFGVKVWDKGVHFDQNTYDQIHKVAAMPFIHKHVAVMPDAHLGKGATIGSVIATKGAVIPSAVGVDIGCLDKDTEFLSPKGWIKISEWDGEQVGQFDLESDTMSFVNPQRYIKKPCDMMYHFKTKYGIDMMLSSDHKVLSYRAGRKQKFVMPDIMSAKAMYEKHITNEIGFGNRIRTDFPIAKSDISLTYEELNLIPLGVAISADATTDKNKTVFNLVKARKIKRLIDILTRCRIDYHISTSKGSNSIRISFDSPIQKSEGLINWSDSLEVLEVKFREIFEWDGNINEKCFYTRKQTEADFVCYMFGALGYRPVIRKDVCKQDGKIDYRVYCHTNTKVGMEATPKSNVDIVVPEDGMQYCFTVPSGFFVVRRNNNTFITGNCGMMAYQTTLKATDLPDNLKDLRTRLEHAVPHGFVTTQGRAIKGSWDIQPQSVVNRWRGIDDSYQALIEKHPKVAVKRSPMMQLGTLGGGNHFIEICLDENDMVWVMLHSGSRGIGNRIGQMFIERAKEDMRKHFINLPDGDLAYLVEGTDNFEDYCDAVEWAQDYASENRKMMMENVLRVMHDMLPPFSLGEMAVNCHHNYISKENHYGENVWVTRKGAIRARSGELGIIPSSMGTGSFIVEGLGNEDSFCSCSHGAGRVMSRTQAKKLLTVADHIKATDGVECRKDKGILDESPAAYKDIDAVMKAQDDLVRVRYTIKQVLNIKG